MIKIGKEDLSKASFKLSKIIVFVCLIITAGVMYWLGNSFIGGAILVILSLFLIFNKVESIERRVKMLEIGNEIEEKKL